MIYRWDDLCESQDFEHNQKFVKAEHWREACDELDDKLKTITFKDQEITKLKKALDVAITVVKLSCRIRSENEAEMVEECAREAQKQIQEIMESK